jgi:hypothetical protein
MPSPLQLHGPLPPGRAGWQSAVRELAAPAARAAALGPSHTPVLMSNHDPLANWFELVARPLWGLAPLAAGGGAAPAAWAQLRAALTAAVDPGHRWYVGEPGPVDQKLVEAGAVGYALAVAPEQLWEPLTGTQRDHLARWLSAAYLGEVADTNWHFFPVLVGLGLDRVGVARDRSVADTHLAAAAGFARAGGWDEDGPGGRVDYYNPFAFHWYGLLYAALAGDDRFVAAAVEFAGPFAHWFAADGAAVPYGRSLGYRFAQGAYWGALAAADVPALPWGEIRGLAQRHLQWWWRQPILDSGGGLTLGYRYPNHALVEQYLTAGSPYWALKFFAPLAIGPGHPFWTSAPAPPPRGRVELSAQPGARALLARDEDGDVVRLNGQSWHPWARNGQATYGKLVYGTLAGFAVPTPGPGPACACPDGALLLAQDEPGTAHWRGREDSGEGTVDGDMVEIDWTPWPDVRVRTALVADPPWHLRVHHVETGRALRAVEGGWCAPWRPAGAGTTDDAAWAAGDGVHSLLVELGGARTPEVIEPMPGTHLLWPRTRLPVLSGRLDPGVHRLACAVRVARHPAAAPTCPDRLRERVPMLYGQFRDACERNQHHFL